MIPCFTITPSLSPLPIKSHNFVFLSITSSDLDYNKLPRSSSASIKPTLPVLPISLLTKQIIGLITQHDCNNLVSLYLLLLHQFVKSVKIVALFLPIHHSTGPGKPITHHPLLYSSLWLITIDSIISLQFHLPYKIPSPVSLLWLYYVFSKVIVHDYYDSSFVRIFRVMLSINDRFCLTVKSSFLQSIMSSFRMQTMNHSTSSTWLSIIIIIIIIDMTLSPLSNPPTTERDC